MDATAAISRLSRAKQEGRKLLALTAYDYPVARLLDECGLDLILVGDSLGMVVLGYQNTTHVTMDHMIHHTRAVARGAKETLIIGDLPYRSYEKPELAVSNATRLIEAGAHAVKLEGALLPQIEALRDEGIPVMGHLGMLPQNIKIERRYRKKGKTQEEAAKLVEDALAMEQAGIFALVLELVIPRVSAEVSAKLSLPTIGIGSGTDCDGQILVTHDLVGMFPWFRPAFVDPKADLAGTLKKAVTAWIEETKDKGR